MSHGLRLHLKDRTHFLVAARLRPWLLADWRLEAAFGPRGHPWSPASWLSCGYSLKKAACFLRQKTLSSEWAPVLSVGLSLD